MEPGTVYSLTITPIVHGKSGRPKLVIFTTEPKRVTNLEVDIDVDCTTEERFHIDVWYLLCDWLRRSQSIFLIGALGYNRAPPK